MLSNYSPRGFLRQVSNVLLQQYFDDRGLAVAVDWSSMGETDIGDLYDAWLALPEDQQELTDADFTAIHELANDEGVGVLIEEGGWHNLDLAATFESFNDQYDMVTWAFLEEPRVFEVATLFRAADRIAARSWRKTRGLPDRLPDDAAEARERLAQALSGYFLQRQGRGRHCEVEVYQRGGQYYYFAFLEDYARAEQDYVGGRLVRQTHRRAFQVVYVFSPARGTVDVSAKGGQPVVSKLTDIAVEALLGTDAAKTLADERTYALDPLIARDFVWSYPATAGIASVWVKSLRLSRKAGDGQLVLRGTKSGGTHALYSLLTGTTVKPGRVDPDSVYVTQAEIRAEYAARNGHNVPPRDFRVTYPNSCSLGTDERDRLLREMLVDSGVDPSRIGVD